MIAQKAVRTQSQAITSSSCDVSADPTTKNLALVRCGSIGQGVSVRCVHRSQTGLDPSHGHNGAPGRAAFQFAPTYWRSLVQTEYAGPVAQLPACDTIVLA